MSPRVLEPAQMLRLFERKAQGDKGARDKLIFLHLGLARYFAKKFTGLGEPFEDLLQVATIGLINAVDRFDPNRGIRFATFATPTILGELKRYFRDKGRGVKVPRRLSELGQDIATAEYDLTQQFKRPPTVSEIAEHLGVHLNEVLEAILARDISRPQSLEQVIQVDFLGVPDPAIQRIEGTILISQVLDAIAQLDERSRTIIQLRYFENKSQVEIGRIMGYSQMYISRLLQRVINEIREILSEAEQEEM